MYLCDVHACELAHQELDFQRMVAMREQTLKTLNALSPFRLALIKRRQRRLFMFEFLIKHEATRERHFWIMITDRQHEGIISFGVPPRVSE